MKVVDLDSLMDEELFEEVSEECSFTVEGACGGGFGLMISAPPVDWMLHY